MEPRGADRNLDSAVRHRQGVHQRVHRERRKASLEVVDGLALVGRDARDVDEPGDLVRAVATVITAPPYEWPTRRTGAVELLDDRRRVGSVVWEPAQRVGARSV